MHRWLYNGQKEYNIVQGDWSGLSGIIYINVLINNTHTLCQGIARRSQQQMILVAQDIIGEHSKIFHKS